MNINSVLYILQGILVSLEYTFISLIVGGILGVVMAVSLTYSNNSLIKFIINSFISLFRGTPTLVQLSFFYFAFPAILHIDISVLFAGVLAFSLNSAAYICEIVRGGINAIDKGQFEVCKTFKIPFFLQVKDIILPQALRNAFPSITNEVITLFKETALISTIGGMDIMRRANLIAAEQYTYLWPLIIAALSYYIITMIMSIIAKHLETKVSYD